MNNGRNLVRRNRVHLKPNHSYDVTLESTDEIGSTTDDIEPSQDNRDAPEKEQLPVTPPQHPTTLHQSSRVFCLPVIRSLLLNKRFPPLKT